MKKLIITVAAFSFITGCNAKALHEAYQKTHDSYAFVKGAYQQIREDAISVGHDMQNAASNLAQDAQCAADDFQNATAYMSYQLDELKKAKDLKSWIGENKATNEVPVH